MNKKARKQENKKGTKNVVEIVSDMSLIIVNINGLNSRFE